MDKKTTTLITIIICVYIAIMLILGLTLGGCISDGQGGYKLSLSSADKIEKGADAAAEGLGLVSLFVPGLAGIAGIAGGVAGAFKKLKPELTKTKATTEHIVTSIEAIKRDYPETWTTIKDKFKDGTNADIEEVIDSIIELQNDLKEAKTAG